MSPETLIQLCAQRGLTITTAESCTGGLIAAMLTDVPGASRVFDRGFVTYSNASKTEMLGIPPALIQVKGAVSEPVAAAMAEGARKKAETDLAVAVTGIAGPGGGSPAKPVGTVCIAVARKDKTYVKTFYFKGNRQTIRRQTAEAALGMVGESTN